MSWCTIESDPGINLLILATVLHFTDAIPINKQLYSFSYVCFTAGAAGVVFSAFYVLICYAIAKISGEAIPDSVDDLKQFFTKLILFSADCFFWEARALTAFVATADLIAYERQLALSKCYAGLINSLPSMVVNEELEKQDGLACAICKDSLFVGTVVNQLPCFHLYHPSCILPWLSARSSCPLCRYELPTDDKDHEDRKQGSISGFVIHEIPQLSINEDGSSNISEAAGVCEFSQGTEQGELVNADHAAEISNEQNTRRWFFLAAAAPIVSLVGIVLVLWLGNPLAERREPVYHAQRPHPYHSPLSGPPNQSKNRSKRWWLF